MATTRSIIARALRRINYLDRGQDVRAEDAANVLEHINAMMHAWVTKGLTYTHATIASPNTTFPLADRYHDGFVAMLALRCTDDYAPEAITPLLRRDAASGWAALCGNYFEVPESGNDLPQDPNVFVTEEEA